MKKLTMIILCLCMTVVLAACGLIKNEPAPSINIKNPIVGVENAKAFEKMGIFIDAPTNAANINYAVISGKIAQIVFEFDGREYLYRAAKGSEDISGINYDLSEKSRIAALSDIYAIDATVYDASGTGTLVKWEKDGISYTLWCEGKCEDSAIAAAVTEVVSKTFTANDLIDQPNTTPVIDDPVTTPAIEDPVTGGEAALTVLETDTEYHIDLDGDGEEEAFSILMISDQYGEEQAVLYIATEEDIQTLVTDIAYDMHGYAKDFDGDGYVEIFLSGDCCSSDYSTWCCRLVDKKIVPAEPAYQPDYEPDFDVESFSGSVESVENGYIVIGDIKDVLGTHGVTTNMVLTPNEFRFIKDPNTPWMLYFDANDSECWEYGTITTAKELPVRMDGENADSYLKTGTTIGITQIDATNSGYACHFVVKGTLATGIVYVDEVKQPEGYMERFINGISIDEYFEMLPYAG